MLAWLASLLFFAVVSTKINRMDIVYPSIENYQNGTKRIKFRALEQDIDMLLEPAGDIISEKFAIMNGNGDVIRSVDVERLKRNLYKNEEMIAAVNINEEGPPIINGIINSQLKIKPNDSRTMIEDGRVAHRITEIKKHKHLHLSIEGNYTRMMKRTIPRPNIKSRDYRYKTKCIKVEYLFITESNLTEMFYDKFDVLEIHVLNTLNHAQTLLNTIGMGIQVSLFGIMTYTKETESTKAPFIEASRIENYPEYLEPHALLSNMGNHLCDSRFTLPITEQADVIILLTKRLMGLVDEKTGQLRKERPDGIAYTGGVCYQCLKFGITAYESYIEERADTLAHESAHLLGCVEDGTGPKRLIPDSPGAKDCPASDGYLMGDRIGDNAKKFSPCCKKNVENVIRFGSASCIMEDCF